MESDTKTEVITIMGEAESASSANITKTANCVDTANRVNDIDCAADKAGEPIANEQWRQAHYSFFVHRDCEHFPCHPTDDPDNFNCLFCYCPLYPLGTACGGNFRITDRGVKSCAACMFPHRRENYGAINDRYPEIAALAAG